MTDQTSSMVFGCRSYHVHKVVATYIAPDASTLFVVEVESGRGAPSVAAGYVGQQVWAADAPWRVTDAWLANSWIPASKQFLAPGDAVALKVVRLT